MSAWIVSKNHIDAMVHWAIKLGLTPASEATQTGRMLWIENLRSVAYRYPNDHSGARPGPTDLTDAEIYTYTYSPPQATPANKYYDAFDPDSGRHAALQVCCYSYQSCEHPGWDDSAAAQLCRQLTERLPRVRDDAYDRIPWGV